MIRTIISPGGCSDSTYEGLKLSSRLLASNISPRSDSTYEGLKPECSATMAVFQLRSDSTYEGLKLRSASRRGMPSAFRQYL